MASAYWVMYAGSGAVELRYDAVFQVQTFSRQTLQNLSGGTLDLTKQQNTQRPSVVIRRMSENAALWDLARQYRTTAQSIQQANHLTQPEADAGQLLLIPM
jgi:LysM repeat protein